MKSLWSVEFWNFSHEWNGQIVDQKRCGSFYILTINKPNGMYSIASERTRMKEEIHKNLFSFWKRSKHKQHLQNDCFAHQHKSTPYTRNHLICLFIRLQYRNWLECMRNTYHLTRMLCTEWKTINTRHWLSPFDC